MLEGLANAVERVDQISADDVSPIARGTTSSLREEMKRLICAAGLEMKEAAEVVEEGLDDRKDGGRGNSPMT